MPWRELYWHRNFFCDKVSHLKHPSVGSIWTYFLHWCTGSPPNHYRGKDDCHPLKFGWIAGASKLTPVQSRGGALRADYAVLVKKGARVPAKPHIRAASSHQRPLLPPPRWPPHLTTPILTNHPYLPAICPSHNWKSRARASMQDQPFL